MFRFVRNGQFFPSFGTPCFDNFSSVSCRHPFPEAVFVFSFPVRWLKCSFHPVKIFWSVLVPEFRNAKIALFLILPKLSGI